MNETKEEEILQELKRISKLIMLIGTKDLLQKDRIALLSKVGFQPKDMTDLLGIKLNVVTATLSQIRKAESQKEKTKAG